MLHSPPAAAPSPLAGCAHALHTTGAEHSTASAGQRPPGRRRQLWRAGRLGAAIWLGALAGGCRPSQPEAPMTGAQVFAMACARCHGAKGQGDGARGGRFGAAPSLRRRLPLAFVQQVVRDGRGAMPSHRGRLTPAQIDRVAAEVSGWGPR